MTVQTLTPNNFSSASSAWTVTGAGSVNAALADASDSSYVKRAATDYAADTSWLVLGCSNYTLGAGEKVRRVRVAVRALVPTFGVLNLALADADTWRFKATTVQQATAKKWIYGPWETTPAGGGAWTQARLDAAAVSLKDAAWTDAATISTIYEAKLEVEIASPPTTTVTAPTGTATAKTATVAWTYSDPQGYAQKMAQIRVFSSAVYGAGGFDPATSQVLTYGVVTGQARQATIDVLPATTQRAYVRTQNSNGQWSDWAYSQFTANVEGPAAPVVTVSWSDALQRATVTIKGRLNELTADTASLEATIGTWANDTNVSGSVSRSGIYAAPHKSTAGFWESAASGASRIKTGTIGAAAAGDVRSASIAMRGVSTTPSARVGIRWIGPNTITWGTAQTLNASSTYKTLTVDSAVAPASTTGWEMVVEFTAAGAAERVAFDQAAAHVNGPGAWGIGGATLSSQTFTLERSYDGTTWETIATDQPLTGLQTATIIDTTCRRFQYVFYRATATATFSGLPAYGTTSSNAVTLSTGDGRFWLKTADSSGDLGGVRVIRTLEDSRDRQTGVFVPVTGTDDIAYPVVVEGALAARTGTLDIITTTSSDTDALNALLTRREALLLQDPYGDQFWLRVQRHDREKEGPVGGSWTRHKVAWVEVG